MIFFNNEVTPHKIRKWCVVYEDLIYFEIEKFKFTFKRNGYLSVTSSEPREILFFKLQEKIFPFSLRNFNKFIEKHRDELELAIINEVPAKHNKDYMRDFFRRNYKHYDLVKVMI
jgi:hypothetical protein